MSDERTILKVGELPADVVERLRNSKMDARFDKVDEYAAITAKEVLAPFRDKDWESPATNLAVVLTRQRADRLEQAIAEAIHAAAHRPDDGHSPIFVKEPGR
jgi:hypothetical protein